MYGLKPVPFRLEGLNQRCLNWISLGWEISAGVHLRAVHLRTGLFAGGRRRFTFADRVEVKPCAISALL